MLLLAFLQDSFNVSHEDRELDFLVLGVWTLASSANANVSVLLNVLWEFIHLLHV